LTNNRISFASIPTTLSSPDLLNIQLESFEDFLQLRTSASKRENKGLQSVFLTNFPIMDNKEFYRLDFLEYNIEKPRYSIEECEERGLTFAAPLKAKLRLSTKDQETEEFIIPMIKQSRMIYVQHSDTLVLIHDSISNVIQAAKKAVELWNENEKLEEEIRKLKLKRRKK